MLRIDCPWCGERAEVEFTCGGEAHIARPENGDGLTDGEWADYLFMRRNPKGVQCERWCHSHGCGRWFHVARSTVTHAILAIYRIGDPRPEVSE
jgi:sarcosine oxidase subunit delta